MSRGNRVVEKASDWETNLKVGARAGNDRESVLAIDIGGGTTKLAMVCREGTIYDWQSFATSAPSGNALMDRIIAACQRIQAETDVAGVSVAAAGFVSENGVLQYNANLPWLEGTPIATMLKEQLGLRVQVEADSNAACAAEFIFGQGRGSRRFLCLTGGTGLGVGMIVEGKLLRIAHGCMGDAGHVIVCATGPKCTCGGRGCAEAMLSTETLAWRYSEAIGREGTDFRRLVEDGENAVPEARELLREAGSWFGIAAASLANIFFPDRIAIAGGLSQAGEEFFASVQESFHLHCGRLPASGASLARASNRGHATLLGAAACFFYPDLL